MSAIDTNSGVIAWFARNPVAANLLMMIIMVVGIGSAFSIQRAMFPAIDFDTIWIEVIYPGAAPEEVEQGVILKIEEAINLTKQAVALRPTNGYYVDSLGWAFFKKGLLTEALAEIKRAAALVGDDPVIYEHLGEIYLKQRQMPEAREALLRSLELDPSNSKLMERFREAGLGDPTAEERVRQAMRRVSDPKSAPAGTP